MARGLAGVRTRLCCLTPAGSIVVARAICTDWSMVWFLAFSSADKHHLQAVFVLPTQKRWACGAFSFSRFSRLARWPAARGLAYEGREYCRLWFEHATRTVAPHTHAAAAVAACAGGLAADTRPACPIRRCAQRPASPAARGPYQEMFGARPGRNTSSQFLSGGARGCGCILLHRPSGD
jgi:hypothetical protein